MSQLLYTWMLFCDYAHICEKDFSFPHMCAHSQKLLEAEKFASSHDLYSIKYYLMFIRTFKGFVNGMQLLHYMECTADLR